MSWILYRGTSSGELGLVVVKLSSPPRAARRVQPYEIEGRHGALHVSDGAFKAVKLTATLQMLGTNRTDQVSEWLDGSGDLVLSSEPDRCYKAAVYDAIDYTRIRLPGGDTYDLLQVTFDCTPFRYLRNPLKTTITGTAVEKLVNPGNIEAAPKLILTGSGDGTLRIGGETLQFSGLNGQLTIDCEAMMLFSDAPGVSMVGDFPVLGRGVTEAQLGGGITELVVWPNWRWA